MAPSGMLRRVALVRTGLSEEHSASFIRATRFGELGTKPAVTSNRRTLRKNNKSLCLWTLFRVGESKYVDNTAFRKLDLFPCSGVGRETPTLLGTQKDLTSITAPVKQPQFPNRCALII
jgi:hypothetical protein